MLPNRGTAPPLGLLLLTGGAGQRFGAPKHLQPHPQGGSWGDHLVRVFRSRHPGGPVRLLGAPLPEHPLLIPVEDPREGPAHALRHWAAREDQAVQRWWVLACDQISWSPLRLQAWEARARAADPHAEGWVLAQVQGRLQFLGGFLGSCLLPQVAGIPARSLWALQEQLPVKILEAEGPEWDDVDTPQNQT